MKKLPKTTPAPKQLPARAKDRNTLEWDINHADICICIQEHIQKNGSMPSKSLIAQLTGLSRETIYKHYEVFNESLEFGNPLDTLNVMTEHVAALVLKNALRGHTGSQRLYFEIMSKYNNLKNNNKAKQQNNYVQINKTIINQQVIQQLDPEQIDRIEQFLAKELQKKTGGG